MLNSEIRRKLQRLRSPSSEPVGEPCAPQAGPEHPTSEPDAPAKSAGPQEGRLGRLRKRLGLAGTEGLSRQRPEPPRPVLPGDELPTEFGPLLAVRTLHDPGPGEAFAHALPHLSAGEFRALRHLRPADFAFLDMETAGLQDAPLFLVGILRYTESGWETLQLLARDYDEELALIAETVRVLRGHPAVVTFNGTTFDVPFLRARMRYHRLRPLYEPEHHVDLLRLARRQLRHVLPDCRLQTLEAQLLGQVRSGDIRGMDVPGVYHDFVAGDGAAMPAVLEHNRLDLLALLKLAPLLGRPEGEKKP